jgi:hypothetical protein
VHQLAHRLSERHHRHADAVREMVEVWRRTHHNVRAERTQRDGQSQQRFNVST